MNRPEQTTTHRDYKRDTLRLLSLPKRVEPTRKEKVIAALQRLYSVEGLLTLQLFIPFGLWLLSPMWDTFGNTRAFAPIRLIWPNTEDGWGMWFFLVGVGKLYFVLSGRQRCKWVFAALLSGCFAFIATVFAFGNFPGTGAPSMMILAIYSLVSAYKSFRRHE